MLKHDRIANKNDDKGFLVVTAFRVGHFFAARKQTNMVIWVLGIPYIILYRILVEWLMCIELPLKTNVGVGLGIRHGQGLVVHPETRIGNYVILRHNTTIGNKRDRQGNPGRAPVLEDNVDVGANVVIIGNITIGKGATIGAGSVVVKDVPAGVVVIGNPAKILETR